MEKQLCINRLSLPDELLSIIKDFAFIDIVSYSAITRKNIIHTLIQRTRWVYRTKKYNRYMFWIEEDRKCSQYQMLFCDKCGDYTTHQAPSESDQILCRC
jgi:hypothetical protein